MLSWALQLQRARLASERVLVLVALTLAMTGWAVPGFGFAALAALLFAMEGVVRRVASAGQLRPRVPMLVQALTVLLDPMYLVLIARASAEDTGWLRLFVPAVLFGLLHLGERLSMRRWRRSYADRVILTLILFPAVVMGITLPVVAVLALAVLVTLFLTLEPRD